MGNFMSLIAGAALVLSSSVGVPNGCEAKKNAIVRICAEGADERQGDQPPVLLGRLRSREGAGVATPRRAQHLVGSQDLPQHNAGWGPTGSGAAAEDRQGRTGAGAAGTCGENDRAGPRCRWCGSMTALWRLSEPRGSALGPHRRHRPWRPGQEVPRCPAPNRPVPAHHAGARPARALRRVVHPMRGRQDSQWLSRRSPPSS